MVIKILLWSVMILMIAGMIANLFLQGKKNGAKTFMNIILWIFWVPVGLFSVAAAIVSTPFTGEHDLYTNIFGISIGHGSNTWIFWISLAIALRACMHIFKPFIPNLKYYSTAEMAFVGLIALGAIDPAKNVKVTEGAADKAIKDVVQSAVAATGNSEQPTQETQQPQAEPPKSTDKQSRVGTATTIKVEQAYLYREADSSTLIIRKNGQPSYLIKDQDVMILAEQGAFTQVRFNQAVYWVATTSIN